MLPTGFLLTILAWTAFVMIGLGLFFWASRWFPRQPWFARSLLLLFLLLGLFSRHTKWAIPCLVILLVIASAFIPRRR
jgi:hypothetical protein